MNNLDPSIALAELNFSKRETATYLALLRLQIANAHQIAKVAGVERTTIYDILESLVQRGLATKSIKGKRQTYVAEPPQKLTELIERQRTVVAEVLPALTAITGKSKREPVVRFYDTIDGIRQAVMNTVQCREKLRRDFASVESIVTFLGKRFIDRQIEERVRLGVRVRSLRGPESKSISYRKDWYLRAKDKRLLREIRYLPKKYPNAPVVFIHDDTVTIISSKEESYALVIKSKELAQAQKVLFDIAWDMAGEITGNKTTDSR